MDNTNYYHSVTYRKCNACGYTGQDTSFNHKTQISDQGPQFTCMNGTVHCPQCDSQELGEHYQDKELTKLVTPPEVVFIEQPGQKQKPNAINVYTIYPNGVSVKPRKNAKVCIYETPEESLKLLQQMGDVGDGLTVDFLRADLSPQQVEKIGKDRLYKGKVILTRVSLRKDSARALMMCLIRYFDMIEPQTTTFTYQPPK